MSSVPDFSRFAFISATSVGKERPALLLGKQRDSDTADAVIRKNAAPETKALVQQKPHAIGEQPSRTTVKGLVELYCDESGVERPLKLLIVGHNPSDQSWEKGHYYANPSNRMWPLLAKASIVPSHFTAVHDKRCPGELGIGFTDIMSGVAETHSSTISDSTFQSFKHSFYKRVSAHVKRAGVGEENTSVETAAYPRVIAFAGVRQWKALFPAGYFEAKGKSKRAPEPGQPSVAQLFGKYGNPAGIAVVQEAAVPPAETPSAPAGLKYGLQTERPSDWPSALAASEVFLLPSSSGAAAMTTAEREGPYLALGQLLQEPRLRWVPGEGLECFRVQGERPAEIGAATAAAMAAQSEACLRIIDEGLEKPCAVSHFTLGAGLPSGGSSADAIELD
jgi:TDG/mug DNA glycosylase family protein